jgi:hypothetical protein
LSISETISNLSDLYSRRPTVTLARKSLYREPPQPTCSKARGGSDTYSSYGSEVLMSQKTILVPIEEAPAIPEGYDGLLETCEVCYIEQPASEFSGLKCGHNKFCKGCTVEYLDTKVGDGEVRGLYCMQSGCKEKFTREKMEVICPEKIFRKYIKFNENIDVERNPNMKWCPKIGCNKFVTRDGIFSRTATCECG